LDQTKTKKKRASGKQKENMEHILNKDFESHAKAMGASKALVSDI